MWCQRQGKRRRVEIGGEMEEGKVAKIMTRGLRTHGKHTTEKHLHECAITAKCEYIYIYIYIYILVRNHD